MISLLLASCSTSAPLNCHYEPVRGSVVVNRAEAPLQVSFTPDSAPNAFRFKRAGIDMSSLDLSLHNQGWNLESDQRYDAIVNIRTTGKCAPYVVYLLR
ncbi:hypothetical protein GZ77_10190 [Endozoicomonas montiporae]|uniref:Uncharacterized protein n=2 Tax=Endozoicomonas montiporae TaxID=1027273 RepID=A0A081N8A1_9GAMM|nr:hypothetical protein GZ77_10190 [Endozoicomonas montiporae]